MNDIYQREIKRILHVATESKKDLEECNTEQMRNQIMRSINGYLNIWSEVFKDDSDMLRRISEYEKTRNIK